MTPRPARLAADIAIDLPRPRRLAVKTTEPFNASVRRIRELFEGMGVLKDDA
jgi:NitT/TauT family transport system ATP-binding protein